jgi:hypothetical protein
MARALRSLGVTTGLALLCLTHVAAQEVKSIRPGMSEAEVRSAWGDPLTVRKSGVMSYLYYRNDCLKRCGTYDIVFLEHGQVVDAVVRDRNRRYDGIASSPADRKPEPTIHP